MKDWELHCGDCLEVLKTLPDCSVDSLCTDPPGGISFMNQSWDSDKGGRDCWIDWLTSVLVEANRLLKPGAHVLVWAIPRTSSWTARALEDAGFEVRDIVHHLFSTGFPKSRDISKDIDKLSGAEREVVSSYERSGRSGGILGKHTTITRELTIAATDLAKEWDGFGTAIKPATEHWILARKPLSEKSIVANVLKWGTGALNIDGCRVDRASDDVPGWHKTGAKGSNGYLGTETARNSTFAIRDMSAEEIQERCGSKGRWPTNLVLSHGLTCDEETCEWDCPVAELGRQSGRSKSPKKTIQGGKAGGGYDVGSSDGTRHREVPGYADEGTAARFFPTFRYVPKASKSEREYGLDDLPTKTFNRVNPGGLENDPRWAPVYRKNTHPTVKPVQLMRWLVRLITPPGGTVLDPFCGSGSTGVACLREGFGFIGIEMDEDFVEISKHRLMAG